MKNVVAIHGSFGHPFENWMPWLNVKCGDAGLPFFAPVFPSPEGQTYENWAAILDGYKNAGVLTDQTTLVAHSSGASFILKYATRKKLAVRKFISVSGFTGFKAGDPDFDAINAQFYLDEGEHPNINGVSQSVAFYSPADPFLPVDVLTGFVDILAAKPISVADGGHFNSSAGYETFEALLEEILTE
jgi:hypothetical protein